MRSKLTKTIILIVFVVFLGINNVEARTCTYSYAGNRINTMYIIETDSTGKVTSIQFKEVDVQTDEVKTDKDMTGTLTADFVGCPSSFGKDGNTLTTSKSTYKLTPEAGADSNNPDNGYVGSLDPGEEATTVSCGEITDIPSNIPKTTKVIYNLIQIFVPIVLVVLGMLDLAKAVMAQKEDEIKKGQQTLIKRLVAAAIVFFIFSIVKMVATYLSDNSSVGSCMNCFIKGDCQEEKASGEDNPESDKPGEDGDV